MATFTAVPLLAPLVVTTAVRLPALVGFTENVTVSEVAVAAVTLPTAPSLKTTELLWPLLVASKPVPAMEIVVALAARLALLAVTVGDGGHLDCRAAAHSVGRDHGGQVAGGGELRRTRRSGSSRWPR